MPTLLERLDRWAYDHPWGWALVAAVAGIVVGSWIVGSVLVAVGLAALGFVMTGWSVSRGPGSRRLARKYGPRT